MNEDQEPKSEKSALLKFFSHPTTGFIGVTASVIAIPLAIYLYYVGIQAPQLVLLANPVRTAIVQAGKVSDFSVSLHGKPVTGDLTALQIIVWNSGKKPIRHEDILKPIEILGSTNCPIYEATVRSLTRDVIGFQLVTNNMAEGRLGFDWKILEKNDGVSVQVIYGGNPEFRFGCQGVVVDQQSIPFRAANVEKSKFGSLFFVVLLGLLAVSQCLTMRKRLKAIVEARRGNVKLLPAYYVNTGLEVVATIGIIFCFGSIVITSYFTNHSPPFPF